jgi:sulfite oxidase
LDNIDVEAIPSLQEQPVQSAITFPHASSPFTVGEKNTVRGYAYSGGGRGIVRVDVSIDGGKTWKTATLTEGKEQPLDRAWAWTFWECDFDIPENEKGREFEVICKATDASYNVQPDSVQGIWNLRGINNNAWHRVKTVAIEEEEEQEDE